MNFRTTLVLLILVVAAGIAVYITQQRTSSQTEQPTPGNEHKLTDLDSKDITRVAITNAEGKKTVLEKSGANWKLVEPVKAEAKSFEVDTLVNDIAGLQSRGQVDESQKAAGGLDHPSFVVELTGKNGKVTKLQVGDKQPVGDTLLVLLDDRKKPDVVSTSLYTNLDKPASNYRKAQLAEVSQDQIKQLTINKGKSTIKLEKSGAEWRITEPKAMPADSAAVSDLLFAITGLNATEFVSEDASKAANYGLTHPKITVSYSTQAPTTQPATNPTTQGSTAPTTQPANVVTIKFGDYEDLLKRNIFAEVDQGPIAKVTASSETSFDKLALDLRNKEVVNIDPEKVQRLTLQINTAATTQPTTKPADLREFTIERIKEEPAVLGPMLPTTQPTTQPAVASTQPTTQPSTQPALATTQPATQPASKWFFASGGQGDADEGQVTALLTSLHPLRAEKYLESSPTTQPSGSYNLTIHTADGADFQLRFTDPGNSVKLIGSYNDLTFELDRTLVEKLTGDFKTKKPEAAPPSFAPGAGMPPLGIH
jgi:hypothetical protein